MSLLVGARFGVSQILNHKLNMISTIIDFHYISRVEVLSESDRVSMLKIYLHDIQVSTQMFFTGSLQSVIAKQIYASYMNSKIFIRLSFYTPYLRIYECISQ